MNIETAKGIPLREILALIGFNPSRERGSDLFYFAPWRVEKTASLHVNTIKNVWYDHGEGKGGDVIAFVSRHLHSQGYQCTVTDALRWLKNMAGYVPTIPKEHAPTYTKQDSAFRIHHIEPIEHPALVRYLESRGITRAISETYLKELRVYNQNTRKYFFALGLKNEDDGYELRNQYFKGSVKAKTVTFIRGTVPKPDGVHLFEGFMDFLSAVTYYKDRPFKEDVIILNSLSCMKDGSAYIKNYGYRIAYTWFDNDEAGHKATEAFAEFFKTEEALEHKPMNDLYAPYKDVNAWHMASLEL